MRNVHTRTKSQNKGKAGLVCGICKKKKKKVRGEADKGMMSGGTSTGWRGGLLAV